MVFLEAQRVVPAEAVNVDALAETGFSCHRVESRCRFRAASLLMLPLTSHNDDPVKLMIFVLLSHRIDQQ